MSSKLPSINLIKKNNLNLNLKPVFNIQEIKNKNSRNPNIFKINKSKNRTTNSLDDCNNLRRINLTNLIYRKPKTIYNQSYLNQNKNNKDINKMLKSRHSKIFGKPLLKSSSVKLYPTGSLLRRLTIGNMDEIEKFAYYQKIENTKSYQDYLMKERAYIPQESIDNSFAESSNEINKISINNTSNKKHYYNKNSIYDSLNPLNAKNTIKIKSKFKNQSKFEKYLIENFIKNHKENMHKKGNNTRNIFIILDGEILINEYDIKGFFIEIPDFEEIKTLNETKRKNIMNYILKKSQKLFKTKKPLITIFSPDKESIIDVLEIKKDYKFLYVSPNIICIGVSLVTTPTFLKIYNKRFKHQLKLENRINNKTKHEDKIRAIKKKHNFKIKEIIQGIKPKYEKYKLHYSYAEGESDILYEDYIIYSDNEERKKSVEKNILKNCYLKNDFYLHLNKINTEKKINELKKKLKYNKPFDLRESYQKFTCDFDKIVEKYKREVQKQLKINPRIYKIDHIDSKINSHNLQYPNDQLTNLYINQNNNNLFNRKQIKNNSFYHCIDKNVTKHYTPFVLHNIPKLLSEFKNYTRNRLFEIYTQYKDLVVMSYSKYKSDFILKNGVDFDTFWYCVEQVSDEKKKFVEKIYNQINRSKLCVLNMEDFLRGMYFIQNTDITEKLDLFLKALDLSGKGVISYKEAVEICKDSIQRNLSNKKEESSNNIYALNELSQFFATFIFKLIGLDTTKILKLDDLKKAILEKSNDEYNEIEYLEMFCGANK